MSPTDLLTPDDASHYLLVPEAVAPRDADEVPAPRPARRGMTRATGHPYQHVLELLELLEAATRRQEVP